MEDIEDFKKSIGKKSRLLGIDPGKKRVGIAISDENKLVSTPLKTIIKKNNTNVINDILEIIKENNICLLYTSPSPRDRQKTRMPSSA